MDLARLGVEIYEKGIKATTEDLRAFEGQAKKAETATALLMKAAGLLGAVFSVTKLIDYTNRWTDLNSRIVIATGSISAGAATMDRLSAMARRTYSSLELTAESFLRNSTAMRDLGYSTNQTLDFVESINNALVVSGAKGERAESVMNALGKAMALGKLSGDELNTVIASGGRIAEALADSMGVTTVQLRKLGQEGKITGQAIYEGLTEQLETLRAEADSMPATIGDAFVLLNNSIMKTVGTLDQMTGASSKVAEGIIWVADNLEMFAPILSGVAGVIAVALIPALASATAATWALTAALLANPLTWVALAVGAVVAAAVLLIQRMGGVEEAFLTVQTIAMDVWERIKAGGQSLADVMSGVALMLQGAFTRAFANIAQGFAGLVSSMGGAAGMFGLDAAGAAEFAKGLHTQAAAYEAGSQIAFGNAGRNWGRATGPGAAMDNVGVGASWGGVQDMFGPGATGLDAPGGAGGAGGGSGPAAKADEYAKLTESILENIEALKIEAETLGRTDVEATKLASTKELMRAAEEAGRPLTEELIGDINAMATAYAEAEQIVAGVQLTVGNPEPWEVMREELASLDAALAAGAISWDQYNAAVMRSMAGAANSTLGAMGQISGALAQAFEGNKAFAVANAIINTAEGVTKALAQGGMFAFPIAAALAVAGAAQVATILSASPGGGTSVRAPSSSAPPMQSAPQRQQQDRPPERMDITLRGLDKSAMYSGENLEAFLRALEERSADGRILNIKVV